MRYVEPILPSLERPSQLLALEVFSQVLEPRWIREAIEESGRSSRRRRLLPAETTLWIVVLLCLFRRQGYADLLEQMAEEGWLGARWSPEDPPSTGALSRARDRLGSLPFNSSTAAPSTPG